MQVDDFYQSFCYELNFIPSETNITPSTLLKIT